MCERENILKNYENNKQECEIAKECKARILDFLVLEKEVNLC